MKRFGVQHRPQRFDVLLVRRNGRWVIGLFGHSLAFACTSYARAAARARTYAQAQGVDVWRIDDDVSADRLVRFRDGPWEEVGSRSAET
jgi:hypothetical protein